MTINDIGGNTKGPALLSVTDVLFLFEVTYCAIKGLERQREKTKAFARKFLLRPFVSQLEKTGGQFP